MVINYLYRLNKIKNSFLRNFSILKIFGLIFLFLAIYQFIFKINYRDNIVDKENIINDLTSYDTINYGYKELEINTYKPFITNGLEIFFNGNLHNVTVWKPDAIEIEIFYDDKKKVFRLNKLEGNSIEVDFNERYNVSKVIIKNESPNVFYKEIIFYDKKKLLTLNEPIESLIIEYSDSLLNYIIVSFLFILLLLTPGILVNIYLPKKDFFQITILIFMIYFLFSMITIFSANTSKVLIYFFYLICIYLTIKNKEKIYEIIKKNFELVLLILIATVFLSCIFFLNDTVYRLDKAYFLLNTDKVINSLKNFVNNYAYSIDSILPFSNSIILYYKIPIFSDIADILRNGQDGYSYIARGVLFSVFYQWVIVIFGDSLYVYLRFVICLLVIFLITLRFLIYYFSKSKNLSIFIPLLFLIYPNLFSYFNFIELSPKYISYIFLLIFIYFTLINFQFYFAILSFVIATLLHISNGLFILPLSFFLSLTKDSKKQKYLLLIFIVIFILFKFNINYFFIEDLTTFTNKDIYTNQVYNFIFSLDNIYYNLKAIVFPGHNLESIFNNSYFYKNSFIFYLFLPNCFLFSLISIDGYKFKKKNSHYELNLILLSSLSPIIYYLLTSNKITGGGLSLSYMLFLIIWTLQMSNLKIDIFINKFLRLGFYILSIMTISFFIIYSYKINIINHSFFEAKPIIFTEVSYFIRFVYIIIFSYLLKIILMTEKLLKKNVSKI